MKKSQKTILLMCFSFLFGISLFFMSFSEPVWAQGSENDDISVHEDISTFQKNYVLSAAQKEYTIKECKKVVAALEKTKPDMSDLEKYFALAVWANQRVDYDWKFWHNSYNFDYYSHQWDAYGAMNEDETSVCVGIAIFYSNLCHAADLPCRFVRLNPGFLEHTINYIPDINGNAYYADITENIFLMSGESRYSFGQEVDKDFAKIPKEGPGACIDKTFDFRDDEDSEFESSNIKDFYDKNYMYDDWFGKYADQKNRPTYEDWFAEYADHHIYEAWFREYADHDKEITDKLFDTDYVEKGSGLSRTDSNAYHASYRDPKYPSDFVDQGDIWFLDDFYENPEAIKAKILNKELDAQLLDVSGLEEHYDCSTIEELKTAVARDISVRYFPTSENTEDGGKRIVAESAALTKDADYEVIYAGHDDQTNDEVFTIKSKSGGAYQGECQIRVKWRSAAVVRKPVGKKNLVYNKEEQELIEPGEAQNGAMQYALGTRTEPTEEFSADIPTAKNAGNYYVWYKVAGDGTYYSTEPKRLEKAVSIAQAKIKMILDDMTLEVGETGVISPKFDKDTLDGAIPVSFTFENWNEDIASVTEDGVVKGLKVGRGIIIVNVNPKYSSPNYTFSNSNVLIVRVVQEIVDIGQTKVALSETAFAYNGKVQKPSIKTIKGLELKAGTDYEAIWPKGSKNAGKYTVTIKGIGKYTGTTDATYTINKAKNPITLKAKAVKVKYKSLKKKSQSIKRANAFAVSEAKGKLSYKLVSAKKGMKSFRKKFSVNGKTGKVTVKKGLKKGTYKVKVKVKAAGNANYKASAWKTVTFKMRVN